MIDPIIGGGILAAVNKAIDHFFPNTAEAEKRKQEAFVMLQQGEFKHEELKMSAILAEANSKDPWTSRARPSFLYVIYIFILSAIPMGFVAAFNAELAIEVANGMGAWLEAIPTELYTLFGAGYLGYTYKRSQDKAASKELFLETLGK